MSNRLALDVARASSAAIARIAVCSLKLELRTHPKPGLVSHADCGAHRDMDAALLELSADTLFPFFRQLAEAGEANAGMAALRRIGIAAETAMLRVTNGVNTHRGAIFGLGLLAAAAGCRRDPARLGQIVAARWGADILALARDQSSHGANAEIRFRAGGARAEAATGFRSVYETALPALREGRRLAGEEEAARVQSCMALIATIADTNLLHRGGLAGLAFAQGAARGFLAGGGVGRADWRAQAQSLHRGFIARNLSPGGCADLLAMALFIDAMGD